MTTATILADNGVLSGSSGLKTSGGNDGTLVLQTTTSGGTATTAVTIDTSQNTTMAGYLNAPNTFGFKNRIINGGMGIDQRNSGASVTPVDGQYTLDRWMARLTQASKYTVQQNAGSVTPPTGFVNYLGVTSSSSYSVISTDSFTQQYRVEGLNLADLSWGAAGASSVTVSFWVRSSLTGTFGGSVANSAADRCYVFSYTISSANTWEYKTVTIPGDTSGTWLKTNGIGMFLTFSLGSGSTYSGAAGSWGSTFYTSVTGATSVVGTNGATFYITGVQLEKGTQATSFDFRSYGTEFALCQRYYEDVGYNVFSTGAGYTGFYFRVTKRATPSIVQTGGTALSSFTVGVSGGYVTGAATTAYFFTASAEL